jgi:site-specific DNA-adenine methylase
MPTFQFPIDYPGTKFAESAAKLNYSDYANYSVIVEPFGGTFGFSRWLYTQDPDHPRRFIVCDNNAALIATYQSWKNMTLQEFTAYIEQYNVLLNSLRVKDEKDKMMLYRKDIATLRRGHPDYALMIEFNMSRFTYKRLKSPEKCAYWWAMFQKTEFIVETSTDLLQFDKPGYLVYVDPPYLMQCNGQYAKTGIDYSKLIYDAMTEAANASIMFVHSGHFMLTIVFGKWATMTYAKRYGMSQKQVEHTVYCSKGRASA